MCELNAVSVFKIYLLNLVPNPLFCCHFWSLIGTYFWGFESLIGLYKDPMCLRTLCRHSANIFQIIKIDSNQSWRKVYLFFSKVKAKKCVVSEQLYRQSSHTKRQKEMHIWYLVLVYVVDSYDSKEFLQHFNLHHLLLYDRVQFKFWCRYQIPYSICKHVMVQKTV